MKNHLSKLSMLLIGFVGGVAFLISCGSDSTNDVAAADVPVIDDQMFCTSNTFIVDETSTTDTLFCMKQSTKVKQTINNMSEIYAEGWVLIQLADNIAGSSTLLFYK